MARSRLLLPALILGATTTGFALAARPEAQEVPKPAPQVPSGAWALSVWRPTAQRDKG